MVKKKLKFRTAKLQQKYDKSKKSIVLITNQ